MSSLSSAQLTDYIEKVFALEKSVMLQGKVLEDFQRRLRYAQDPSQTPHKTLYETGVGGYARGMIIIPIIAFVGYYIVAVIVNIFMALYALFRINLWGKDMPYLPVRTIKIPLIVAAVAFIIVLIITVISESSSIRKNRMIEKENRGIDEKNEQTRINSRLEAASLQEEINDLEMKCRKTQSILAQAYNMGIIYKDYRNIYAVSAFLQYFRSGRCNTLTGYEGAYNLYENERRLNLILMKEDQILENQEATQSLLRNAIIENNRSVERLDANVSSAIGRIEDNTAISTYNSEITANNTWWTNWLVAFTR